MRNPFTFFLATIAIVAVLAGMARAEMLKLGDLEIEKPMIKATPPKAPVSGGFLIVLNKGGDEDRLVGAKADFADKVEIHEMNMEGDVMKMRPLSDGVAIPAGGQAELKPGGYHLMFMNLKEQMKEGEIRKVTLQFAKSGEIEVPFEVGQPIKPMN